MPITSEDIQGGEHKQAVYQCYCGDNQYFRITRFDEDYGGTPSTEYFVHIDLRYQGWKDRLKGAWMALKGLHKFAVGEVIMTPEQIRQMLKEVRELSK